MENNGKKMYTLNDIAKELGVNKATVSKAISGKGNLSAETRERILAFIDKCGYRPNAVAQSLARNRTYNIGLMMPNQAKVLENAFFRECLSGVCEVATANCYDVLMAIDNERTTENIARLIDNRKIDGVIAMRSFVESPLERFLKDKNLPFVLIGTSSDESVMQVDNANQKACCELTELLIRQGARKLFLLGGDDNNCVTHSRLQGFLEACEKTACGVQQKTVLNISTEEQVQKLLPDARVWGADCIICMDDFICNLVMVYLKSRDVRIPEDVKIASFYDSALMQYSIPSVTSLHFDATELGKNACRMLINKLEDGEQALFAAPSYQIMLRESTENKS